MIAIDTSLLVYAHRAGSDEHGAARRAIERAAGAREGWGVALGSVTEFWSVVTHPRMPGRPSTPEEAAAFLDVLVREAGAAVWSPGEGFESRLVPLASRMGVRGARIFDLQIGLTALEGGAREIWTHDGGFVPVPGLRVRDPLAP